MGKASFVWPNASKRERQYLNKVINSNGWGVFRGGLVREFGEKMATYHHANYGIPCANGTVALQVQLQSLGVGRGDEVITTIFTFVATAAAITSVGAIPIFVDIDELNYCIDVKKIEEKITSKTKAIIAVHLYNSLCDLDALVDISREYNIALIEDAAQVPGSFYKGKGVGTFGASGSFSFQEAKVMTAGEGGIILTNDQKLAELANSYVNCGRGCFREVNVRKVIGLNHRMTEFQAAVLLGQLDLLDERTEIRERASAYLNMELAKIPGITTIEKPARVTKQACYQYVFKFNSEKIGIDRDVFVWALEAEGMPMRKVYLPLHKDPLFNLNEYDTPEAWQYYQEYPLDENQYPVAERAAFSEAVAIWHPFLLLSKKRLDDLVVAVDRIVHYASRIKNSLQ